LRVTHAADVVPAGVLPTAADAPSAARRDRQTPTTADRVRVRALLVGSAAVAGAVGAGSFALSFLVLVGAPVRSWSVSPELRPFLPVLAVAASVRAGLFLVGRWPIGRRTPGCVEEVVDAAKR
jgi:hypothetical protein